MMYQFYLITALISTLHCALPNCHMKNNDLELEGLQWQGNAAGEAECINRCITAQIRGRDTLFIHGVVYQYADKPFTEGCWCAFNVTEFKETVNPVNRSCIFGPPAEDLLHQIQIFDSIQMTDVEAEENHTLRMSYGSIHENTVIIRHVMLHQYNTDDPTLQPLLIMNNAQDYTFEYKDRYGIVGSPMVFSKYISFLNAGNRIVSNFKLQLDFPTNIVVLRLFNQRDENLLSNREDCTGVKNAIDYGFNRITYRIPYLATAKPRCGFFVGWHISSTELTNSIRSNDKFLFYDVLGSYSYSANNVGRVHTFRWTLAFTGRSPLDQYPLAIIKNRDSGTCWAYDEDADKITSTSECETVFKISNRNIFEISGRGYIIYRRNEKTYVLSPRNDGYFQRFTVVPDGYLTASRIDSMTLCFVEDRYEGTITSSTVAGDYFDSNKLCNRFPENSTQSRIKLLPVINYDSIDIRSLLIAPTEPLPTIIACNPGGDLGNKYNCFESKVGTTWKAIDSSITTIKFYSSATDSFYGKRNRGKSYFQLKEGRIHDVSPEIYFMAMAMDAVVAENLSGSNAPSREPRETTSDKNIGVSAKGLFKKGTDGEWKLFFRWAN